MSAARWTLIAILGLLAGYLAMFLVRFPADNLMLSVSDAAPPRSWEVLYFLGQFLFGLAAVGLGPYAAPAASRRHVAIRLAVVLAVVEALIIGKALLFGFSLGRLFAFIAGQASIWGAVAAAAIWSRRP